MSQGAADATSGSGKGAVLWDVTENGVIVELEERFHSTVAAVETLKTATTVGQVQQSWLPDWAREAVEEGLQSFEDAEEVVTPETPWNYEEHVEVLIEALPMPHDAASVAQWLGRDFLKRHARVGGASPRWPHRRLHPA